MVAVLSISDYYTNKLYKFRRGIQKLREHGIGLSHRFSKCSVRSPRAPREKPRGSASCSFTHVFIFRNLLWGSV